MSTLTWIKSSFCESGTCVEVTRHGSWMVLRSTLDPATTVEFTAGEWGDFLHEVAGEFIPNLITHGSGGAVTVFPPAGCAKSEPVVFTADEWAVFKAGVRSGEFAAGRVPA